MGQLRQATNTNLTSKPTEETKQERRTRAETAEAATAASSSSSSSSRQQVLLLLLLLLLLLHQISQSLLRQLFWESIIGKTDVQGVAVMNLAAVQLLLLLL